MQQSEKKTTLSTFIQEAILLVVIFFVVLIINYPIISFDMFYPEQALIYAANQKIVSFSDLLNVYTHPTLFAFWIPFFRPSGHFLMYQLIMPLLGWHNTRGLMVVSLGFLALTGYLMIKLYERLFPQHRIGGYVAFLLYLMYPTLNLSRLTVMHFEFAYICFSLLSLYLFVVFCQRNKIPERGEFHSLGLLAVSLFFYVVAVTFKEPAVMLGPVLMLYFVMYQREGQTWSAFLRRKQRWQILMLILLISIIMGLYLTLAWPTAHHPVRPPISFGNLMAAINETIKALFYIPFNVIPSVELAIPDSIWRHVVTPVIARDIIWLFMSMMLLGCLSLRDKQANLFLFLSAVIFLLLPIAWAAAMPWHLSLTIVCLTMMMGFGFDYVCLKIFRRKLAMEMVAVLTILGIGYAGIMVNMTNIQSDKSNKNFIFALLLNRHAVLSPPDIKRQLTTKSVLIVENNRLSDPYYLGAAYYPFYVQSLITQFDFDKLDAFDKSTFLSFDPLYNSNLFKLAYLVPTLREEIYPFNVTAMQDLPNEVIYSWLSHYQDIFCVGYDDQAVWHDKTRIFKQNLLNEKRKRHLVVNSYDIKRGVLISAKTSYIKNLPYPDSQLCEYVCDQDKLCRGFNYIDAALTHHRVIQCQFHGAGSLGSVKVSAISTRFLKNVKA